MKKAALIFIAFIFCSVAHANEADRQRKIAQIIEAQGLHQMFQNQIDQSKAAAAQMGREIFNNMLKELGHNDGKPDPKLEAIFIRYMERCSSMWTANEFVQIWSRHYGQGLSDKDLTLILAYYQSPAGKKDVTANQIAMTGFTRAAQEEGMKRMKAAVDQLIADLKASMAK